MKEGPFTIWYVYFEQLLCVRMCVLESVAEWGVENDRLYVFCRGMGTTLLLFENGTAMKHHDAVQFMWKPALVGYENRHRDYIVEILYGR